MEKNWYTVEEIAEILHIKPATIHGTRWQKSSKCPLIKPGKRLLVPKEAFNNWLMEKAVNR